MDVEKCVFEMVEYCHLIHKRGLVSSSGGNVSIRIGDEVFITPSGKSLQMVAAKDVVRMREDGSYRACVDAKPSKEWQMHLACYRYQGVGAVIHVHSPHAVALSCLKELNFLCAMPVYTAGYATRVGELPVVPYIPSGTPELAEAVSRIISWRNSVLLENHGVLCVGNDLEEALNIVEEIEENAEINFILGNRGKALTNEQISRYGRGQRREIKGMDFQ